MGEKSRRVVPDLTNLTVPAAYQAIEDVWGVRVRVWLEPEPHSCYPDLLFWWVDVPNSLHRSELDYPEVVGLLCVDSEVVSYNVQIIAALMCWCDQVHRHLSLT